MLKNGEFWKLFSQEKKIKQNLRKIMLKSKIVIKYNQIINKQRMFSIFRNRLKQKFLNKISLFKRYRKDKNKIPIIYNRQMNLSKLLKLI